MSSATVDNRGSREQPMQIGEVAEAVGLSLRTVRYYEEVGLLAEPARTDGGFRVYGAEHLAQLQLIKQMKPLGLSLEQMGELLKARDEIRSAADAGERSAARERLEQFADLAGERCADLRRQLKSAERFVRQVRSEAEGGD